MQSLSTIFEYMTQCMGRGLAVSAAIALHNIPGAPCSLPHARLVPLTQRVRMSQRAWPWLCPSMLLLAASGRQ